MSIQYQAHTQRYSPKGFIGLGKKMVADKAGAFVKASDYEREVAARHHQQATVDAIALRDRQRDALVSQLQGELSDSENSNLELVKTLNETTNGEVERCANLEKLIEITDLLASNVTKKSKLKSVLLEYERLKRSL